MIFGILFMAIGILLCIVLPRYKEIILSSMIIIIALFGKHLKLPGRADLFYMDYDEEEKERIKKIINVVLFVIGTISLIHSILSL